MSEERRFPAEGVTQLISENVAVFPQTSEEAGDEFIVRVPDGVAVDFIGVVNGGKTLMIMGPAGGGNIDGGVNLQVGDISSVGGGSIKAVTVLKPTWWVGSIHNRH